MFIPNPVMFHTKLTSSADASIASMAAQLNTIGFIQHYLHILDKPALNESSLEFNEFAMNENGSGIEWMLH